MEVAAVTREHRSEDDPHDFGGLPRGLYQLQYPAPGDPDLADRVKNCLRPRRYGATSPGGLDHGTWSVLLHVYPQAGIPVVQLSIEETQPPPSITKSGNVWRLYEKKGALRLSKERKPKSRRLPLAGDFFMVLLLPEASREKLMLLIGVRIH